jgi:hypothetical protein
MCGLEFLPLHREIFRLAVPGHYFGHPRMGEFFQGLLAEFETARRHGLAGYSFDCLGRSRPLRAG